MNIVLAGLTNCNVHLDDLVVYSAAWEKHINMLRAVFERLAHAFLTLNLAKSEFGKATVTYLGREVGQGRVWPVEEKVSAMANFPVPTTLDVRSATS